MSTSWDIEGSAPYTDGSVSRTLEASAEEVGGDL